MARQISEKNPTVFYTQAVERVDAYLRRRGFTTSQWLYSEWSRIYQFYMAQFELTTERDRHVLFLASTATAARVAQHSDVPPAVLELLWNQALVYYLLLLNPKGVKRQLDQLMDGRKAERDSKNNT